MIIMVALNGLHDVARFPITSRCSLLNRRFHRADNSTKPRKFQN